MTPQPTDEQKANGMDIASCYFRQGKMQKMLADSIAQALAAEAQRVRMEERERYEKQRRGTELPHDPWGPPGCDI